MDLFKMRKIKCISLIILIGIVSFFPYSTIAASQDDKNLYRTSIKKEMSTIWTKDFDIEDIDLAIKHIDYLLSNNNNALDTYIPKGTSRTKDYLKEIRSMLLADNKYEEVTLFFALVTVDIDGQIYLAPFEARILAARPKNGIKIYLY